MKLGCHAVLFKDRIASQTEQVLAQIKETGFSGTEIGSRFFGTDRIEELNALMDRYQLNMSGMHTVVMLKEVVDNWDVVISGFLKVVDFVGQMPCKNIIMTGLHKMPEEEQMDIRLHDADFVEKVAIGLNELAVMAELKGVRVHYHNHSWEFDDNALIFHSIGRYAPRLYIGLDTGWAFYSGYDPVTLINQYPGRYHYVHLRDYDTQKHEFVPIGSGHMNFARLMERLDAELEEEDWAIVEYETGEEDYKRYTQAYGYIAQFI